MKSYSAVKNNELLIHSTTWMDFQNITLSEKSQAGKTTWFNLYEILKKSTCIEQKTDEWLPATGIGDEDCQKSGTGNFLEMF